MVDAEHHRGERVQRAADGAEDHRGDDPLPGAVVEAEVAGADGAEDHHALEADVDHARALGPQAGQRRRA